MPSLLFVCTGNICRSPFAERYAALLRDRGGWPAGWDFASAGVGAMVGSPMEPGMARRLTDRGGDPAGFVARQLDRGTATAPAWLVTMEAAQRRYVLEEWPTLVRRTFTLGQLLAALDGVAPERRGEDALRAAGDRRLRADPDLDVPDPYGRGDAAADAAADRLVTDLDRLAARLA